MTNKGVKEITAVIVAPYYGWVGDFWVRELDQDVCKIETSIQLLDWTLAGLDRSIVSKVSILCHPSQSNLLKYLKNITLIECSDASLINASIDVFKSINGNIIYIYPWVVFRQDFCKALVLDDFSDVVLGANHSWLENDVLNYKDQVCSEKLKTNQSSVLSCARFLDKEDWSAAFSGVAYLNKRAISQIIFTWNQLKTKRSQVFHDAIEFSSIKFSDLIQELIDLGLNVAALEVDNNVIVLQKLEQLTEFVFGTKGKTLERLRLVLEKSNISDLNIFTVFDWDKDKVSILNNINKQFKGKNIVVRSSSIVEDGWDESLAGAFYSALDVDISLPNALEVAITDVINSYKKLTNFDNDSFGQNQVLIQEFIHNIDLSGVIFTRDLHVGAPYYIINYDPSSGRTDSVTSGDTNNLKTLVVYRDSDFENLDDKFKKLLLACKEVESKINCDSLDIEFSISNDGLIHIFQVRPMAVANTWKNLDYVKFNLMLERITDYAYQVNRTQGKTVFSNMTDWNPAEMISTSPSPLAMSLYEYLITDSTWRVSRGECGYCNPSSESLMVSLGGKPYINVRSSFKSFVPESIPVALQDKFVDCWVDQLIKDPGQHDKVEFDIVPTCYTFDLDFKLTKLVNSGVEQKNVALLKEELLTLTDLHISQQKFNLNAELNKVNQLEAKVKDYVSLEFNISTIKHLLEDCRTYGILPFSNLARMAFIATDILKSLVNKGILNSDDESNIKGNIHTITSEVIADFESVHKKQISMNDFLEKYGHLRPGTYDINSKRYDEDPSLYLHENNAFSMQKRVLKKLDSSKLAQINTILKEHGFKSDADDLMVFISDAIRGRENAKFGFTKAVSLVLKMIEQLGEKEGVFRSDMAFINIHSLFRWDLNVISSSFHDWLEHDIAKNKEDHLYGQALNLPDIIIKSADVHAYYQLQTKPNFVTKNKIISESVCLDMNESQDINNKIVLVRSSDPGFDWIFTHNIEGLVTMYGGANSHMAIRCAEFDIPAVIGCGQAIYESLLGDKLIEIDCAGEIVRTCLAH